VNLRPRVGEGMQAFTDEWLVWCERHDRLIFSDSRIGWCLLRKERVKRKGKYYDYWRAFKWPAHGKPPVRVYVGKLETVSTIELRDKMRELVQRDEEKTLWYQAEKVRLRKEADRQRKRRYRRRRRAKVCADRGRSADYPKYFY
jgi:hypothetical protein